MSLANLIEELISEIDHFSLLMTFLIPLMWKKFPAKSQDQPVK